MMYKYLSCALLLAFLSCKESESEVSTPQKQDDGWEVAAPNEVGLDDDLINAAIDKCEGNGVDALLIVKDGKLVAEAYYNDYDAGKQHKVWSVTKAVTATIIGIAIEEGDIRSVDDSMSKYLGAYADNMPEDKKSITIANLLSMSSGIEWVELGGRQSAGFRVAYTPDWVDFVLQQPMAYAPGDVYNYSSGNYMLLAPILRNATGIQADEYAKQHLFEPMGINNYEWVKGSEFWTKTEGGEIPSVQKPKPPIQYPDHFKEYPNMGSGLKMLPRDMAKLGLLCLNNGKWQGKQIVSETWVNNTTKNQFNNTEYGYGWRIMQLQVNGKSVDCFYASGFGQQGVYVFPQENIVVVFTQQNYTTMGKGRQLTEDSFSIGLGGNFTMGNNVDVHESVFNYSTCKMLVCYKGVEVLIDGHDVEYNTINVWAETLADTKYIITDTLSDVSECVEVKPGDSLILTHHLKVSPKLKYKHADKNRDTIRGQLWLNHIYGPDGTQYSYGPIDLVPMPR